MSCPEDQTPGNATRLDASEWRTLEGFNPSMIEAAERAGRRVAEEIERLTLDGLLRPWTEEEDNDKSVAGCPSDAKVL